MTPYDTDLDRNAANFQPLTPLSFLERAAAVFPDHTAIIHGRLRRSYAEFYARSRRLASSLAGVFPGAADAHWKRRVHAEQAARLGQLQRKAFEGVHGALRHLLAEFSSMSFIDFLETLTKFDAILLGAIGDPRRLPDSVSLRPLIQLRQRFDQYACLRPVRSLAGVERDYILSVLRASGGNRKQAALQLGIGLATLYRKLSAYGR